MDGGKSDAIKFFEEQVERAEVLKKYGMIFGQSSPVEAADSAETETSCPALALQVELLSVHLDQLYVVKSHFNASDRYRFCSQLGLVMSTVLGGCAALVSSPDLSAQQVVDKDILKALKRASRIRNGLSLVSTALIVVVQGFDLNGRAEKHRVAAAEFQQIREEAGLALAQSFGDANCESKMRSTLDELRARRAKAASESPIVPGFAFRTAEAQVLGMKKGTGWTSRLLFERDCTDKGE
jgi:hypothetical protein